MQHHELCPIPPEERMPDSTYCLWCEVIDKVQVRERERFADAWNRDSHAVRFNKAHDDLTPHGRVLKWIRTVEL